MKERCKLFWNKISRIGLREGEDALLFREVILLNRILMIMLAIMLFYIPVEIYLNGTKMIGAVIAMIVLAMGTLVFHCYRLFKLAHFYLYFITTAFIIIMGLVVGRTVQNHVILAPVILVSVIMFKTTRERVLLFLITIGLYLIQQKLFSVIEPIVEISEENKKIFAVIFFVLAMTFTFVTGFYFLGINKEYESIIITQKENLEVKNKEITDSITYAKRIQTAILPPDSVFKKHLKESFILYLPKDVVAGDFYWMEHLNDVVLFAAADCTGHGVPGAMVSVVCNNALNRSVREEGITDPGRILDRTRDIIVHEFGKSNEDVKDGMDISLCALNTKTLELKWAGANNPLWYVRNGELLEVKPDKQPIGQYFNAKPFTTHSLKLQAGDVLYVTTDGYQDQFGGEKGKKYKASNLKQLLLDNHHRSLEDQKKAVMTSFIDWKGKNEQVDDVCIIGVKI